MVEVEVKNRFTGQVICTGETVAAAVVKSLADLRGANLRGANLREANLREANLREANLSGADLSGADLRGADIYVADLSGANLREANLREANLRGADLREANLRGADLRGANLYGANLSGADLYVADLRGADLRGANLYGADLSGAKIAWQSHDLLAEILKCAAGDDIAKLKVAGLILIQREWCWREFLAMRDREPLAGWALDVLAEWVQDGDEAPNVLREIADAKKREREQDPTLMEARSNGVSGGLLLARDQGRAGQAGGQRGVPGRDEGHLRDHSSVGRQRW
jgi:hypothetical protein